MVKVNDRHRRTFRQTFRLRTHGIVGYDLSVNDLSDRTFHEGTHQQNKTLHTSKIYIPHIRAYSHWALALALTLENGYGTDTKRHGPSASGDNNTDFLYRQQNFWNWSYGY